MSSAASQALGVKYNSEGGANGILGLAKSDLQADANTTGFHIDYQGGTIYWSTTAGAHSLSGDILQLYRAQGGPQSGIGFPITDEASTIDGVCRFTNFEHSGAIYWTAEDGAHLIYGEIYKKWIAQGGEMSGIGYPITNEALTTDGVCSFNVFKHNGAIYYTPALGAFLIYGEIYKKWIAQGGEASGIGYPITDETSSADGLCQYNIFHNGGAIYYTPALGAFLIYGEIYKKWLSLGGEVGFLGYPITDETSEGSSGGAFNNFKGGSIHWLPATGARIVPSGPLPLMVAPPSPALGSNENYFLGDGGRTLMNLSVTINIDFDLTSSANGVGFQLNTYSGVASAPKTPTWQQYVVYLDANTTQLWAMVDNWYGVYPATDAQLINTEKRFATVPSVNAIRAGSKLNFTLLNDSDGTITGCIYNFTDPTGRSTSTTISLADATVFGTGTKVTAAEMAPILALTMNIVGDYNIHNATLTGGEGQISYSCTNPLTVSSYEPNYTTFNDITGETANTVYGALPTSINFAQWWGLTTPSEGLRLNLDKKQRHWLPPHRIAEQKDKADAAPLQNEVNRE